MARVKERRPPCPTRQKLDRTGNSAFVLNRNFAAFRSTEMKTPSFTHLFGTVFEQRARGTSLRRGGALLPRRRR